MDALDEFFREWCEPEAWCDRCKDSPAVHIVVQGSHETDSSIVTYIRVWDPHTQTHIALCRNCTKQHTDALGSPQFRYAPQAHQSLRSSQRQSGQQHRRHAWLRHLRQVQYVLARLLFPWRTRKPTRARVDTISYSRTGT
jgi:type II secretory pathway component PulJ